MAIPTANSRRFLYLFPSYTAVLGEHHHHRPLVFRGVGILPHLQVDLPGGNDAAWCP